MHFVPELLNHAGLAGTTRLQDEDASPEVFFWVVHGVVNRERLKEGSNRLSTVRLAKHAV
jgi:hypothetical protein